MKLVHHGAHQGVTGSCHQLFWQNDRSLLVDCGIFQGNDAKKNPNPEINFPINSIEAMLLTHVHIDHVGRVPYLLSAGFDKPIYCSGPTARLLPLVMEDALKIGFTRSRNLIKKFLKHIGKLLRPLPYHTWHPIADNVRIRLRPAGHVLGSTIFEVELPSGEVVVFSGDVGTGNDPLLRKPTSPPKADLLVLESTYGDRFHPDTNNRQATLEAILRKTLEDKGVTIIPAFSLGRTQALLYEMNGIFERLQKSEGRSLLKQVDVIVDSPLASRFTELYDSMQDYWGQEAQHLMRTDDQPLVFENLTTVGNHREHRDTLDYLAERKLPAIVVAGSGMCTGGRVVNYLKRFIDEPTADIVFVGYQAGGTPGNYISRGSDWVRFDGRKYNVSAGVHRINGYSAHGDQKDLIEFVQNMEEQPKEIRLVHGDYQPKQTLADKFTELGLTVI
jgi:metallo-beta-lactamase family protein